MSDHNYKNKLITFVKEKSTNKKPGLYHISVYHDDWCKIYSGGKCNCDPDIKEGKPENV